MLELKNGGAFDEKNTWTNEHLVSKRKEMASLGIVQRSVWQMSESTDAKMGIFHFSAVRKQKKQISAPFYSA